MHAAEVSLVGLPARGTKPGCSVHTCQMQERVSKACSAALKRTRYWYAPVSVKSVLLAARPAAQSYVE